MRAEDFETINKNAAESATQGEIFLRQGEFFDAIQAFASNQRIVYVCKAFVNCQHI